MINKNEFLKRLGEVFFEFDELSFDGLSEFREHDEWDSLAGIAVQVMVLDKYGADLTVAIFESLNTFGDIYDFVKENHVKNE